MKFLILYFANNFNGFILASLKDVADYLILLRFYIAHQENSKVIGDLLVRDLESLDEDSDPNVLPKLKVFR